MRQIENITSGELLYPEILESSMAMQNEDKEIHNQRLVILTISSILHFQIILS